MNFSEEWRFLWPVSESSHAPPLLPRAAASSTVGPLLFQPLPHTLTHLLSSPLLSPSSLAPPPTDISISRFIETSSTALPSTSAQIAAEFSPFETPAFSFFSRNRLHCLPWPDARSVLAFFPAGNCFDRVGFLLLSVTHSNLSVIGALSISPTSLGQRILQLAVCEVVASDDNCLGYLMASTVYSVHWFRVKFESHAKDKPDLVLIYTKSFKSSSVVNVCYSPHLPEESLVLLESGRLLLCDVGDSVNNISRLPVSWDQPDSLANKGGWFGCEFTWNPRIVVVANSDTVFLVDFRSRNSKCICLMKLELLGVNEKDRFVALSKAGSDGFCYAVASECCLVLLDIRTPCKPVLKWMLDSQSYPHYLSVFPLSGLRGNLGNAEFNRASEAGYAIVLGSFWTGEFRVFCYGPSLSSGNKVSNPFYAWDLPSYLSISGLDCPCSTCLLREELGKGDLSQHKKPLALGFFVLDKDISSLMSDADGFVLIRLMSSGKLESQRYSACWGMSSHLGPARVVESPFYAKDYNVDPMDDEKYRFSRKLQHIKLENLYAYLNGPLTGPAAFPDISPCVQKEVKLSESQQGSDASSDCSNLFDDLCPIDLSFHNYSKWNVGPMEMHAYSMLKEQFKNAMQQRFNL